MELRDFLELAGREPELRLLVIGGHAVAAHGHTRATFDAEFLVRRGDRPAWALRAQAAGLAIFEETEFFTQFSQGAGGESLDLMIVSDATFEEFWRRSEVKSIGDSKIRVPCLEHLLALKLHALKQALPHRTSKDAEDVEMMIRRNKIDLAEPAMRALFLKYGTLEIYDTFIRLLRDR